MNCMMEVNEQPRYVHIEHLRCRKCTQYNGFYGNYHSWQVSNNTTEEKQRSHETQVREAVTSSPEAVYAEHPQRQNKQLPARYIYIYIYIYI